eukprot:3169922-Rhodomonas_salina.1
MVKPQAGVLQRTARKESPGHAPPIALRPCYAMSGTDLVEESQVPYWLLAYGGFALDCGTTSYRSCGSPKANTGRRESLSSRSCSLRICHAHCRDWPSLTHATSER